jgi:hypothetical protein
MQKNRDYTIIYLNVLLLTLWLCSSLSMLNAQTASAWPAGASPVVPVCTAAQDQFGVKLIKVIGGYIAAWQDQRRVDRDIYSQKFDDGGIMKWPADGRVIAEGNNGEASNHLQYNRQTLAGMADDAQGGAITLWTEEYPCGSGPCGNGWITRIHAGGNVQFGAVPSAGQTVQGTDTAVQLNTKANADAVVSDGEGGAFGILDVDAWGDWYVFRINANGAYRAQTSNVVGARAASHMLYGGNSNGKDYVYIAWIDYGNLRIVKIEDPEINYPTSLDTLTASWSAISLTTSAIGGMSLAPDGEGGVIVVWEDNRNGNYDIFAQRVSEEGNVQWAPVGIPIVTKTGDQRRPQAVSDDAEGAVIAWEDVSSGAQVYAQRIDGNGALQWTVDGILLPSERYGLMPKIVRSSEGNFIVAYRDIDSNGGTMDYYWAQKVTPDGVLLWKPDGQLVTEVGWATEDFDVAPDDDRGVMFVWAFGDIWAKKMYPAMAVAPLSRDFGSVDVGYESAQTFTLSNTGTVDIAVEAAAISGPQASHFVKGTDGCTGQWLAPGGTCTVQVAFKPQTGGIKNALLSVSTSDTLALIVSLNGAAPPVGTVAINGGAGFDSSLNVTLTLTAAGEAPGQIQMCISNTATCSSWEPFSTSRSWTLEAGDGLKTVSVWLRDSLGNTVVIPYSATITLDTTAPVVGTLVPMVFPGQTALQWSGFTDTGSGIDRYRLVYALGGTPGSCSSGTFLYEGTGTSYVHAGLPNGALLYYRLCAYDRAGNGSGITLQATSISTCNYQIAPTTRSFAAAGGSGSVTVTTQPGCSWSAVSSDSWIPITSGAGSSGGGTVNYQVLQNISTAPRAGTIAIGVQTLEIHQSDVPTHQAILALVTKYYNDILDRAPEPGGAEGWTEEVEKITTRGVDLKEGFQALAKFFFNSAEYAFQNKNNTQFVTDLYQVFFSRSPDQGGLDYWLGYLSQGLTRNMLITQFANSPEFTLYLENIFGSGETSTENNLVNDFYRGFLDRFPDSGGFNYWLGQMRSAQCSGAAAVTGTAKQIATLFFQSAEYAARARSNAEFVEDLYNGIMRRGAEAAGFQFWIDVLNGGMSRLNVLNAFIASPEFANRVNDVIATGCLP